MTGKGEVGECLLSPGPQAPIWSEAVVVVSLLLLLACCCYDTYTKICNTASAFEINGCGGFPPLYYVQRGRRVCSAHSMYRFLPINIMVLATPGYNSNTEL